MNYAKLRKHIIALAALPRCEAPVISAYFDLSDPKASLRRELEAWAELTRHTFTGAARQDFDDALEEIGSALEASLGRSLAVFARWGEYPMVLPIAFDAPLETSLHADAYPVLYPLVELKDRFNRFVVVLTTSESARIIEMNLGSASTVLLAERPELQKRLGREWTREHYVNHRRERDRRFVKEKIKIIEGLMAKRGHNALIVAGTPKYVARLTKALPKRLQDQVVDEINTGVTDARLQEILSRAVQSFLDAEHEESHDAVERLVRAVRARGLATIGIEHTKKALLHGQADQLILSSRLLHDDREELVRLASQGGVPIETVRDSDLLDANGGVGALLRYRATEMDSAPPGLPAVA